MANATVDTPDNQRGVVSPQVQLASPPGTQAAVTVTVPPSAETIIVAVKSPSVTPSLTCTGIQTGYEYVGATLRTTTGIQAHTTYFFDVSQAVDTQVSVAFSAPPGAGWVVYSDAAVHVIVDAGKLLTSAGVQYMVGVPPSNVHGDHPPVELQQISNWGVASGATILGAPGSGQRFRIFYAQVSNESAGAIAGLADSVSGLNFCMGGTGAAGLAGTADFKPSGLPLPNNAAITVGTTAGNAHYNLTYTQEVI